jgi:hypothetical protein
MMTQVSLPVVIDKTNSVKYPTKLKCVKAQPYTMQATVQTSILNG